MATMRNLLFAYGTLIPQDDERRASEGWVPDSVRGRLYDLDPHTIAFGPGDQDVEHFDSKKNKA
jgi:hypothetical protein